MPAFDPSVIGSISESAPDIAGSVARGYSLADLVDTEQSRRLQLNQQRQDISDREKARDILKTSQYDTPAGVTRTAEKLNQAGLSDEAAQFMKTMQSLQAEKGELTKQQYEILGAKNDIIGGATAGLVGQFDQLIQQGTSPALAQAIMQPRYQQAIQQLAQTKLPDGSAALGSQDLQQIEQNPTFNPQFLRTIADRSKQGAAALKAQLAFHKEQRADAAEQVREKHEGAYENAEARKAAEADKKARDEDAAIDKTAEAIASYRLRPPTGYAARSPYAQKLMGKVLEIEPDYDGTRFDEKRKAVLAFSTGPEGQKVRSLNVAISHMDALSDLGKALDNGDVAKVNQLSNWWTDNVGGAAPGSFNAARQIVADEINKAVVPGAGGVAEREKMAEAASAASSPAKLRGVITTWKRLLSGQMSGLKRQYRTATGLDNFDSMMSPEALEELQAEGPPTGGSSGAAASSGWGQARVVQP